MPQHRVHLQSVNERNAKRDFYWTGNPDGEVVLILGSCRIIPYLNYLIDLNTNYKIYCVLPYAFQQHELEALEYDENLKDILSKTKIFIKEYHANYGIFNTLDTHLKNIYQFGLKPEKDITIPAWNDHFVFAQDIIDWCKITDPVQIRQVSLLNYGKFYQNCAKTSFPEFAGWFHENFTKERLTWNFNHITKNYSLKVFELMNDKFLHLPLTEDFEKYKDVDHLIGAYTNLIDLDREIYGYQWQ